MYNLTRYNRLGAQPALGAEDKDVTEERERVDRGCPNCPLVIDNVTKVYSSRTSLSLCRRKLRRGVRRVAVNQLSLGLNKGEVRGEGRRGKEGAVEGRRERERAGEGRAGYEEYELHLHVTRGLKDYIAIKKRCEPSIFVYKLYKNAKSTCHYTVYTITILNDNDAFVV